MTNDAAGSYASYRSYWEEVVMCYANDTAYGDAGRALLSFEDYANIAYDFSHIETAKLIAPMWIVDDLYTYIDPALQPGIWSSVVEALIHTPMLPITIGAYNYGDNRTTISVFFKDYMAIAEVQEVPHMSTYDYYLNIAQATVVNPFAQFHNRRVFPANQLFLMDDYLDHQMSWIPCGGGTGYKAMDIRMYLYCLTKRIKTRYSAIQIKAETINKSLAITNQDSNVFTTINHDMQKALLVKMIITNPYVSCKLVIV